MSKQSKTELLHIATIGKVVGLKGDLKLHIYSDFPEQFKKGVSFFINEKESITISDINRARGLFKIAGYTTPEDARKFTNKKLYTTMQRTREECKLEDGEHFWFDIEGCSIVEDDKIIGEVVELDRLASTTYIKVVTSKELVDAGCAKTFLLPYHEPFVVKKDIPNKRIYTDGAMDILEAS
jgi:16S rRNA processing protein RimM